jgi:hypothetical protein
MRPRPPATVPLGGRAGPGWRRVSSAPGERRKPVTSTSWPLCSSSAAALSPSSLADPHIRFSSLSTPLTNQLLLIVSASPPVFLKPPEEYTRGASLPVPSLPPLSSHDCLPRRPARPGQGRSPSELRIARAPSNGHTYANRDLCWYWDRRTVLRIWQTRLRHIMHQYSILFNPFPIYPPPSSSLARSSCGLNRKLQTSASERMP